MDFQTDGFHHAKLANKLGQLLNSNLFIVPKIYAFEIEKDDPIYIPSFFESIKKNHLIFFCGKKVVSRKNNELIKPVKYKNQIIFWDNIFANDYCPKKLMVGPWKYRKNLNNIMINPTGLIETDLFILDIISCSKSNISIQKAWINACIKNNIPKYFFTIYQFFNPYKIINYNLKINSKEYNKIIIALDQLLWDWNSPLSREWYSYLYGLKQDIMLTQNKMIKKNIFKTQTIFLASYLLQRK